MLKSRHITPAMMSVKARFVVLLVLYSVFISHSYQYLFTSITDHADMLVIIMMVVVARQLVINIKNTGQLASGELLLHKWNVLSLTGICFLYMFVSRFVHINLLAAMIGFTGLFILFSFIIPFQSWKKGVIPFILLLMSLPIGRQLDTYIGFPLRIMSVDFVASQMKWLGVEASTRETILVIENRASQVDIDCSGVKGLWIGLVFFITYTWLYHIKPSFRWAAILPVLMFTILFFNMIRVSLLVFMNSSERSAAAVPYFHYSISAFGMVLSCLLAHYLMASLKTSEKPITASVPTSTSTPSFRFAQIASLLLVINFVPIQPALSSVVQVLPELHSTKVMGITKLPFKKQEKYVFERDGSQAQKFSFSFRSVQGEVILVMGTDWRAQHKPELCFEAAGNKLTSISTVLVSASFPVKQMIFSGTANKAYSWFQSPQMVTDDYAFRNWQELKGAEHRWVLVNMVIAGNSDQGDLNNLLQYMKALVHTSFTNKPK